MGAIANDQPAVDCDIADRGAIHAEDDEGQQAFRGMAGDGDVAQIKGEEVGKGTGGEGAAGNRQGAGAVHGGAVE